VRNGAVASKVSCNDEHVKMIDKIWESAQVCVEMSAGKTV
jgi:hypothetical protein